jgi:formyltetrahydrofolate deformylase
LAARLGGEGQLHFSDAIAKVAIFVSRQDHCLVDLLWRTRSGELPMEVALVVSNHADLRGVAEGFAIPFVHLPVSAANRVEAEEAQRALLAEKGGEADRRHGPLRDRGTRWRTDHRAGHHGREPSR